LAVSIVTVSGLIVFIEVHSIIRRLDEYKEGVLHPTIISRNLVFLAVFLLLSLAMASIPFIIDLGGFGIYETRTIHGKAILGLAILSPWMLVGLLRKRR